MKRIEIITLTDCELQSCITCDVNFKFSLDMDDIFLALQEKVHKLILLELFTLQGCTDNITDPSTMNLPTNAGAFIHKRVYIF